MLYQVLSFHLLYKYVQDIERSKQIDISKQPKISRYQIHQDPNIKLDQK